ncbi:MAG: hypothetical protein JOZ36_11400 [Acidobacteria bacterium]|nr:hypothetical protein [Acidobacteriota bacterium]
MPLKLNWTGILRNAGRAAFFAGAVPMYAPTTATGSIQGILIDPSGAVNIGAKVMITGERTRC